MDADLFEPVGPALRRLIRERGELPRVGEVAPERFEPAVQRPHEAFLERHNPTLHRRITINPARRGFNRFDPEHVAPKWKV